jgi:hypothetical protein
MLSNNLFQKTTPILLKKREKKLQRNKIDYLNKYHFFLLFDVLIIKDHTYNIVSIKISYIYIYIYIYLKKINM